MFRLFLLLLLLFVKYQKKAAALPDQGYGLILKITCHAFAPSHVWKEPQLLSPTSEMRCGQPVAEVS